MQQQTIKAPVQISGVGLHSGVEANVTLKPAPANTGRVFVRTDLPAGENEIPVGLAAIKQEQLQLQTVIQNEHGASVATIEHLFSALYALNIDNLIIEIDGPEVPILNGCVTQWLTAIDEVGIEQQDAPAKVIKIDEVGGFSHDKSTAAWEPGEGLTMEIMLDYGYPTLPNGEVFSMTLTEHRYRHEIASAKTFATEEQVMQARQLGLAQGGTLDNALVYTQTGMMNEHILTFTGRPSEPARHKWLDLLGDLAVIGVQLEGKIKVSLPGHAVNAKLANELVKNFA